MRPPVDKGLFHGRLKNASCDAIRAYGSLQKILGDEGSLPRHYSRSPGVWCAPLDGPWLHRRLHGTSNSIIYTHALATLGTLFQRTGLRDLATVLTLVALCHL